MSVSEVVVLLGLLINISIAAFNLGAKVERNKKDNTMQAHHLHRAVAQMQKPS